MDWLEGMGDGFAELFAACLLSAAADALFDDRADGLRLTCALAVALSVARFVEGLV